MIFTIKIPKRFADTDMLGHVNNVNLQHYFDLGKSDMFRRLIGGVEDHTSNTSLIIKATHNVYESPVFMAQDTEVTTQIEKIGNTSITLLPGPCGRLVQTQLRPVGRCFIRRRLCRHLML